MGFFLFVAWPLILPYYFVKTRRAKRTLLMIFQLVVVYFGAAFAGMALFRAGR